MLALCLAVGAAAPACRSDVARALTAADEASYRGHNAQAEQILRRLALRLHAACRAAGAAGTHRGPDGGPDRAADVRWGLYAQVLERLAQLNAVQLHNPQQALADFTALAQIEGDPARSAAALREAADLLRHRLGQPEQAVAVLRRAIDVAGAGTERALAQRDLVATFAGLGNYDAACAEAKAVLADAPPPALAQDVQLRLGQAQFLAQHYDAAAKTFLQLVDAQPARPLAAVALAEAGHAYQELGEGAQALGYYYAALKDHPNPLLLQDKIARVRARMYQLERNAHILQPNGPQRQVAQAHRRRP